MKINGVLSGPFSVLRGVRQGCSLSGMLYSLAIEPLLHKLREDCGVYIPECNVSLKLSAYADDLIVLINSQKDIEVLENTVSLFGCITSAKMSWEKSEAVNVIVQLGDQLSLPGGLFWRKGGLKYLGVFFLGNDTFLLKTWKIWWIKSTASFQNGGGFYLTCHLHFES